ELTGGDLVVAPRQMPRPAPQREIDLAVLLRNAGQDHAIRIEGKAVRRLLARKAAERQPAHLRRSSRRIRLPLSEWQRLSGIRRQRGITGAAMAHILGYRQACSVSEFETGRGLPPAGV